MSESPSPMALKEQLYALAQAKRISQTQTRQIDVQLGETAKALLEHSQSYASKAGIGQMIGASPTTVANLLKLAERQGESEQQERVPLIRSSRAGQYVSAQGETITRVVAGFDADDVLEASQLDPRLFEFNGSVQIPNMIWQLSSGEWIGVEDANVGYGGAGGGNARRALREAGIDEQTAQELAAYRFMDAGDLDHPQTWTKSIQWPYYSRPRPTIQHDKIIWNWIESPHRYSDSVVEPFPRTEADPTGFYPSPVKADPLTTLLDLLDNPTRWAAGDRVARLFMTTEAAAEQGFIHIINSIYRSKFHLAPQLVIEQGDVQIWCHLDAPTEEDRRRGKLLPDTAYSVLTRAGFFSEAVQDLERREASLLHRLTRSVLGTNEALPAYLDLPGGDHGHIHYVPADPDTHP